jgi:hypothetical protein
LDIDPYFEKDRLLQQVERATQTWSERYPLSQVAWTLPYVVDFFQYNKQRVIKMKQDGLSTREIHQSKEATKLFGRLLVDLHTKWQANLPNVHLLDINSLLCSQQLCRRNLQQERLVIPASYVSDGLHPTPEGAQQLINGVAEYIKNRFPHLGSAADDSRAEALNKKLKKRRQRQSEHKARSAALRSLGAAKRAVGQPVMERSTVQKALASEHSAVALSGYEDNDQHYHIIYNL